MFVLLRLLQKNLVDDLTQCTVYNGTINHETEKREKEREELWVLEFLKPKIIVLKKNKNFRVTKRMWKEGRMRMRRWQHFTNENYSLLQKVSERTTCLIGCEGNVWFFVVFLVCLEESWEKGGSCWKNFAKLNFLCGFLNEGFLREKCLI